MVIRKSFAIAIALMAIGAIASDRYYLYNTDKTGKAFTNPEYWTFNGKESGSRLDRIDQSVEYCVYKDRRIYVKDGEVRDFSGQSLVLGEGTSSGGLYNYVNSVSGTEKAVSFGKKGLKINCGAIVLTGGNDRSFVTSGPICVDLVDDAFACISFDDNNLKHSHRGTLSISKDSVLTVGDTKVFDGYGLKGTFELPIQDSCSEVLGTLKIVSTQYKIDRVLRDDYDATLAIASTDLPGTIAVSENCHLKLISGSDVIGVGSLSFEHNAWFSVPYDSESEAMGRVDVSGPLTISGVVNVVLPREVPSLKKVAILTASESSEISIKNFKLKANPNPCWLSVETEGERKVLYVVYPDAIRTMSNAESGKTESWSDGTVEIVKGKDYALTNNFAFAMPDGVINYEFVGNSLNIHHNAALRWVSQGERQFFSCPCLRVFNGGFLHGDQNAELTISGGVLDLVSGRVSIGSCSGKTLNIDSHITGHAEAKLVGLISGKKSDPYARYSFNAPNPDFYGTISIEQRLDEEAGEAYKVSFGKSCSLIIRDALSLGGNLVMHEAKALSLAKYASLIVIGNTTLKAESNRGIFINGVGRIFVDQDNNLNKPYTFRTETPFAINGTFWKEGHGTLELAGTMAFGDDGLAENPTEGHNNFVLTSGVVRVCSVGAIDGCSMLFHEGTSLELAVDFENELLMAQGIRNVKTDVPFVLGEGVEKLPLCLKFSHEATPPSTKFTVPLLTVSVSAADSVRSMLPAIRTPFKSYRSTFVETVKRDGDGTPMNVTFACELQYQAMKMIIR